MVTAVSLFDFIGVSARFPKQSLHEDPLVDLGHFEELPDDVGCECCQFLEPIFSNSAKNCYLMCYFVLRQFLHFENSLEGSENADLEHHDIHFTVECYPVQQLNDTVVRVHRIGVELFKGETAGTYYFWMRQSGERKNVKRLRIHVNTKL